MTTTTPEIDLPEPSPELTQFRDAMGDGRLVFQRCGECENAWLPPRDQCPRCLSPEYAWEDASGNAKVVSWVVYHRAFHPAFADRVPYNVTVVELAEGPRLISNVVDIHAADGLAIDTPLTVAIETEGDIPVARFRLT